MNQTRNCCDMGKQRLLGDGICEGIQGAEVKTLKQDLDKIWADSYRKTFFSKPNTELLSSKFNGFFFYVTNSKLVQRHEYLYPILKQ